MNSSTPFSLAQQRLILSAAALFLLVACWNLLKHYHPRFRRGRDFRYTPLGLLVLALVLAAESLTVVYALYLVPRHPLWFATAAVFGLLVFFVCALVDEGHEKARAGALGTTKQPKEWQLSPNTTVRLAFWYAAGLVCSLVTVPFSLYGELFGPPRGALLAIIGLLLSISIFFLARHPLGMRFLKECPTGLSARFPELVDWRKRIEFGAMLIGLLAFLSIAAMFLSMRGGGGPADNLPVFAPREHYVLSNHGKRTEVSATRFWLAGAGGVVAWHAGTMCASLLALYALFYGEFPPQLKRDFARSGNASRDPKLG